MCPESRFRIAPNWPKMGKMVMKSQLAAMKWPSNFFEVVVIHLSILDTGSSFMSISWLVLGLRQFLFIRNLTRNPETKNTRVWVLSNIRRQGQFNSTWFGMNVSNEKLLVATKMSPASLHLLPFPSRQKTSKIRVNSKYLITSSSKLQIFPFP